MAETVYRFEACELDTSRRELRRDGVLVECQPKVYEVLSYLAERPERVVPKAELRAALWQGEILSEGVLARCIWAARLAVGESGDAQRVIRIVQWHGYRFVAPIVGATRASRAPDLVVERSSAPPSDDAGVPFVGRDGELA